MSIVERQMFAMTVMHIFIFVFLRGTLRGIERVNLSDKAIKMRNKGQSLKEWFTCSRYSDVIPRFVFPVYYIILLINTTGLLMIGYRFFLGISNENSWNVLKVVGAFNLFVLIIYYAVTFDPKCPHPRDELWVPNLKTGKTAKRYKHSSEYTAEVFSQIEDELSDKIWVENLKIIDAGGTVEKMYTDVPLLEVQVKILIEKVGGTYLRTDEAHLEEGTCQYRHIHYVTKEGKESTVRVFEE